MDKAPLYTFEYLDYNNQYQIRRSRSWYGDQGAAGHLHDMKFIISVDGQIHDDFSIHHRLCPICIIKTNSNE